MLFSRLAYPAPPARWLCDDELAAAWTATLARLEPLARAAAPQVDEAMQIFLTIAAMPSPKLIAPLRRLTYAALLSPTWRPVGAMASALIEVVMLEPPPR